MKIILLLILFNLVYSAISNDQVLILKYNSQNDCPNPIVKIPIKSNSALNKFTYCGKYSFRFLQTSVLMGFNVHTNFVIKNFKEKIARMKINGDTVYFDLKNQTIQPDQWQHLCISISTNQFKIVMNGEILHNETVNYTSEEINNDEIFIGGILGDKVYDGIRMEGAITEVNVWNEALESKHLISITSNDIASDIASESIVFTWKSLEIQSNTSCIEYITLNGTDEMFQGEYQKNVLMEYLTDVNSSYYLCQAFGGKLLVPKDIQDLNEVGSLIHQSDICPEAILGLRKINDTLVVDLSNKIAPFIKWGRKQPNGKKFQQCIAVWHSEFDDVECYKKYCFACQIKSKNTFTLRGNLHSSIDREYFVEMTKTQTKIRGLWKTECFWKQSWNFGQHLKLEEATSTMPPVGVRKWNDGKYLKFTQCNENEFTCHTYGHCISRSKRCDGQPDCPVDGSDENECKTMTLSRGYDKLYPSAKNTTIGISVDVLDVIDINELHMYYTVNVKITLKWFDSRIIFENLKLRHYENQLKSLEIENIWTPELFFFYSNEIHVIAGEKREGSHGTVRIHREGLPQQNDLSEMDEDYLYPGVENPISMVNYLVVKLACKFDLTWYPFDTQKCPIVLTRPSDFYNQFVMKWLKPPTIENIKLTQYEALQHLEYDNSTSSNILVEVKVIFCRKFSYHIVNIYLPTLCLVIIAGLTLFIDLSHFEATIMVALTSMLVTYTLYQSISEYLPHTSYLKMIDIWLIGGLLFPFFIITILVIMDSLIMKEKNQVIDLKNEKTLRLTSKLFMRTMQVMIIVTGSTLIIFYWIVGLYHYYQACNIF